MDERKISVLKEVFNVIAVSLLGCAGIVFAIRYLNTFGEGFFAEYSGVLTALSVGAITAVTVLTIVFLKINKTFIYKLLYISFVYIIKVFLIYEIANDANSCYIN